MALERFDGVRRAAGIITARGRKQGTEGHLVGTHQQNENGSHQVSADERPGVPGVTSDPSNADSGRSVLHRSSCFSTRSTSIANAEKGAPYASARIRMTMSAATLDGRSRVRESSRRRRLTRFRATADCRNRGTISPTRVREPDRCTRGEAMARTSRNVVRIRFPSCAIRCSSAPRVMRARRGKPSDA